MKALSVTGASIRVRILKAGMPCDILHDLKFVTGASIRVRILKAFSSGSCSMSRMV